MKARTDAGMSPVQAVAFDLDGTLVDSAPDIAVALNTALSSEGLRRSELADVRGWIGDGPDALIERALAAQGQPGDDAARRARLRAAFDQATLAAPLADGMVFPGIGELLRGLHQRLPMVVVTNKPTPLSLAVLEAAGLLHYVNGVFGADRLQQRKPAPQLLLAGARSLGVAPANLLMVGDGPADMLAAQAAGCPAALVGWGYGGHQAMPQLKDVRRIESPAQLLGELLHGREPLLHH
jgi:phosphoglycolate phosphatase